MDILMLLVTFFFLAVIVRIATDNVVNVLKVFGDFKRFKLVIAFVLTAAGITVFNTGVLQALDMRPDEALTAFHYYDLILSTLFLTSGAQAIHKLSDAWKDYSKRGEGS